jgi:hypothetical protein
MAKNKQKPRPISQYTRGDGRTVIPSRKFDFRSDHEAFGTRDDEREILTPGTILGAMVRYHWDNGDHYRSKLIGVQGEYTGDQVRLEVPLSKWRPGGKQAEEKLPILHMTADTDDARRNLGLVVVSYLLPGESASFYKTDGDRLRIDLGFGDPNHSSQWPYFGIVQGGSTYYIPPLETQADPSEASQLPLL